MTNPAATVVAGGVPPVIKPKRANYFVRHWRGDLSLGVSYWANGFLGTFLVLLAASMVGALESEASLKLVAVLSLFVYATAIVGSVWQLVGVWRSASKHVLRGGSSVWAGLAKVAVVLGALNCLGMMFRTYVPQTAEMLSIIAGDMGMPAYKIQVLPGGTEVEFRGGLRAGCARELEGILRAVPHAKVLQINSPGGRLSEAKKMMRVVREHGLATYTSEQCLSAATLVLMSGKERVVGEWAKVGFHMGKLPGATVEQQREMNTLLQATMRSAGVSDDFIRRVLATSSEEMWYPSFEEMRRANVVTKEDAPVRAFASNVLTLLENITNSNGFVPVKTGHADVDRLSRLVTEFFSRWGRLFVDMNGELEAAGEPEVYADRTLKEKDELRQALAIELKRQEIIEKFRSRARREVEGINSDLASLSLSEELAKGMVKGMSSAVERGRLQAEDLFTLRLRVETDKQRFLVFMDEAFAVYEVGGDKIRFAKRGDSDRYGVLTKAITDSIKALGDFEQNLLKSYDTGKEQVKKMTQ